MKTARRYAPVVTWCVLIFLLSSITSTPAPETWWNFLLKKGAHVTEYAILYWLAFRATSDKPSSRAQVFDTETQAFVSSSLKVPQSLNGPRTQPRGTRGAEGRQATGKFVNPLIFTIFYAITDEIHQSFVPGRHARWYDIGFDTLGALIALRFASRVKHA